MEKIFLISLLLAALAVNINADVYMHSPRGSNDRNCERNVNRNNGNRLFDSQNNNQGGYACPRGVGDEVFQAEDGSSVFQSVDPNTGTTQTFFQNKRMYYYSGSILPIEWTNQHGCGGNSKVNCEIVLQYACEDTLDPMIDDFWPWVPGKAEVGSQYRGKQHFRSGSHIAAPRDGVPRDVNDAATDTIPDNLDNAIPNTKENRRYGMQESYDYYQLCQRTERNKGLYTADQKINRSDRRGTRQNPNGNRHGFECPEERDYYPWWAPSPWIDIAVLSDNADEKICYPGSTSCTTRCNYYMDNTMNYNKKGYCDVNHTNQTVSVKTNSKAWNNRVWYNNKDACESNGFVWYEVSHRDNLQFSGTSFVCAKTQYARVNQLGNGNPNTIISQNEDTTSSVVNTHITDNLNANRFLWTIPEIPTANPSYFSPSLQSAYLSCVVRLRYNISSSDFPQWPDDAVDAGYQGTMVDYRNNSVTTDDPNTPLHQDPYVYIGPGDSASKGEKFVKLKLNTNQYGRTFQDRSYVFSIKPLPTSAIEGSNAADSPPFDYTQIKAALDAGGKIYNVGVRGKRGNIVQTFPAVEYDFVPNALALNKSDIIHFQWTGSDYNPRRGCNDATGGPPDLNTYFDSSNADQNPRADRHNFVLTYHMGFNTPKDYLGYDPTNTTITQQEKEALSKNAILSNAFCYDSATDSNTLADQCVKALNRLSYLNQQSDSGSLILRRGLNCYTQDELDAINNQDVADYHPLNCAKLNAKPYPYFDGGLVVMRKNGWFPFFSSRNNNFSNRQQIGVICVGPDCKLDENGILQDANPEVNSNSLTRSTVSRCYDTAMAADGTANANAAHSCLPTDPNDPTAFTMLTTETFSKQEGDNDNKGDGNKYGCSILTFSAMGDNIVEQSIALAFILLAVGIVTSWLAYYLYNRYNAKKAKESKFRYDTNWQKADAIEPKRKTRPISTTLNENQKFSRTEMTTKSPIQRNDMI